MSALILLIVGIGGYLFIQRYPLSRLKQSKISGWDAYFHVGAWGFAFASVAGLIVLAITWYGSRHGYVPLAWGKSDNPVLEEVLKPRNEAVALWAILTCAIAWTAGRWSGRRRNLYRVIADVAREDELDGLLFTSMAKRNPIQITLSNRKVYAGFALTQITCEDFSKREYIALLPYLSGFRDKDSMRVTFTENYVAFYKELRESGDDAYSGDFRVVVPVSDIVSAANFDPVAHMNISKHYSDDDKEAKGQAAGLPAVVDG